MSFLKPDVTVQSPEIKVPPPPPATPIKPITATATSEIESVGKIESVWQQKIQF